MKTAGRSGLSDRTGRPWRRQPENQSTKKEIQMAEKSIPQGFRTMLSFGLIEALLGRRYGASSWEPR